MAKDMYIHQELQSLKCCICGKNFERFNNQNLKTYNNYCSLECEYESIKNRKYSYELKKIIIEFSIENEYKSTRDIAKIFGVSKDMVTNLIKQYGNREPKKLIDFDRDYFKKIDTEDKAYWLGFIYADGNIYATKGTNSKSLDIALQYSDIFHLEKFAKCVNYKEGIKSRNICLNDKTHKSCRIILSSEEIYDDLITLGCYENKSLILKFPNTSQVPYNLLKDFIRGYVDGDGCVRKINKNNNNSINFSFSLLGTLEFLIGTIEYFKSEKLIVNDIVNYYRKDKRRVVNNYYIALSGNNARNIINYLYKDSRIYLDRKHKVYKQLEYAMSNQ